MKTKRFSRRTESSALASGLRWITALVLLTVALVIPERVGDVRMPDAPRLPVELPIIVFTLMLFSGRWLTVARVMIVGILTLLVFFKLAHMAAYFGFDRPFNPLADTLMLPILLDVTARAGGVAALIGVVAGVLVLIAIIAGVIAWATGTIVRGVPRHRRLPAAIAALVFVGLGFTPFATITAAGFMRDQTQAVVQDVRDARVFRADLLKDTFSDVPAQNRLAALKGKDVLLIFVESYGRSSLDHPAYGGRVRDALKAFDAALAEKGFGVRSAWVVSPTFGGESYLAHSTVLSGLWIDNRQRFAQLLGSGRETLVSDFNAGGWRTVAVMPAITEAWPEADFFRYGKIYNGPDLQYKGDPFEFLTMPDQFTLAAFQTRELAQIDRPPIMAEIALLSSHIPWAPLPQFLPWDEVGDGSIFKTARTVETPADIWRDKRVEEFYARSVEYVLQTVVSFITTYIGDNTLIMVIGDHQPMTFMAGEGVSHEVPMHIISRDAALLTALADESWVVGMMPSASSTAWPMDVFRERFVGAFALQPDQPESSPPETELTPPVEVPPSQQP
jgi:hypothetical protein